MYLSFKVSFSELLEQEQTAVTDVVDQPHCTAESPLDVSALLVHCGGDVHQSREDAADEGLSSV